ncbi:MAG: ATP-binding protein [Actinobacteria bacterium]|nr:ATP-binding protein [Actinomycetota bacterium]
MKAKAIDFELLSSRLRELRLPAMRECFADEAERARAEGLSYEEYLSELVRLETESRREHRVERRLRESRLPLEKSLASFDMKRLPSGVRNQVRVLLDGEFLKRAENVLAFGGVGSGKTHLLSAIGQELVYSGARVISYNCSLLMQELIAAKRRLELERKLKKLRSFDVVLIDDLGYVSHEREEMEVLFALISDRYERKSIILSSNMPFSRWEQIFGDAMTTAAAIDRLVHHSVILELNLPSYRLEQRGVGKSRKIPAEGGDKKKDSKTS